MTIDVNRKTVETMWEALSAFDWATVKSCGGTIFWRAQAGHAEEVARGHRALLEDPGARGPENVVKRLAIAFDQLVDHRHTIHHLVCEGDVVFLDHTEVWTFKTGEKATNQFATLHEMRDGKIARWSDYWDVAGFVGQFPPWFLEEMARHSAADFSD